MRKGLLIEFVGPAGVGKSFAADELAKRLMAASIPVVRIDDDRHPSVIERLSSVLVGVSLASRFLPRSLRTLRARTAFFAAYRDLRRRSDADRCVAIASEGIVHTARSIYRDQTTKDRDMVAIVRRLAATIGRPDVVVILDASPACILRRRLARARVGDVFDSASVMADLQLLEASAAAARDLATATDSPPTDVLRVGFDDDRETEQIDGIASLIRMRMNYSPPTGCA